jgi:hypothetical protein
MAFHVRFACGHGLRMETGIEVPECPQCGETRVARVSAPPPKFRGTVLGPCAEYRDKENSNAR